MVGVIGKAIKGFGKALKSRGRKPGVFDKPYKGAKENLDKIYKQTLRHKTMKQTGLKGKK